MDSLDGETGALLGLLLTPGLGPTLVGRAVELFGSAGAARGATALQWSKVKGVSAARSGSLKHAIDETFAQGLVEREMHEAAAAGVSLVRWSETQYPALLRLIPDAPPLLWVRGELLEGDRLALGIVGSRRCTGYGREQAARLAGQCAAAGLCIVSGGAYGVDIAAHRAAMRVKGRTIAVLGSGLANVYPKDHGRVFDELVGEGLGAVVSELPMGTGPRAENFPRRNRIISGLSLGVLVIEAAVRSGALITARQCVEEHGRECMALPGRVDSPASAGCHKIVREGWATLVTSATEVMDQLGEAGRWLREGAAAVGDEVMADGAQPQALGAGVDDGGALWGGAEPQATAGRDEGAGSDAGGLLDATWSDSQRAVLGAMDGPRSLDELVAATGLGVGPVQADLTILEVRGAVRREGGRFVRRRAGG